jgi:predicted secreted hydrolase
LKVKAKDFAFDLTLKSNLDPIFHGKNGIISMGIDNASYYYSRTRMAISGSITINRKSEAVTGVAWFDHQWGNFALKRLAWDWFGLQLADGSDIMIYQFRDQLNRPVLANGSITREGVTELLLNTDFTLTSGEQWISPKTGVSYPVEWSFKVPDKKIDVVTRSIIKNNEFDARPTSGTVYWVGALSMEGSHVGQGFMRLQGYPGK